MKKTAWLSAIMMVFFMWHCQKDYVTGRSTFSIMSEAQEVSLGRQSHDTVIAQYGVFEDQELSNLLRDRGQKIASVSHRPGIDYHFYVVDSPVVNAFALPGGYVYFTRGILAHFNSEAEMIGVLGHEVGHVVARHGAEQYSRMTLAQVGLGLASALSEEFRKYSMFAELGTSLLFLKFSRNQESESDRLGVQYTTSIGYDGHRMADFFGTIARLSQGSGQDIPNFLSTHPNPDNRKEVIHALVRDLESQGYKPTITSTRADYLAKIDKLPFGENPHFGYQEQGSLFVPAWRLMFQPTTGIRTQHQRNAVQMDIAEGKAMAVFTVDEKNGNARQSMTNFAEQVKLDAQTAQNVRLSGIQALELKGRVVDQASDLSVTAYFFEHHDQVFLAYGVSETAQAASMQPLIDKALSSVSDLTDRTALNPSAQKLRVLKALKNDSLKANLEALHVAQDELEQHAILNGAQLADPIKRGYLLKVVQH